MSISSKKRDGEHVVDLRIQGQFDFSKLQEFRDGYKDFNEVGMEYHIHLNEVEYMDSSALGMILLLKKHAEASSGKVTLLAPNAQVKKILDIANFDQLVSIE